MRKIILIIKKKTPSKIKENETDDLERCEHITRSEENSDTSDSEYLDEPKSLRDSAHNKDRHTNTGQAPELRLQLRDQIHRILRYERDKGEHIIKPVRNNDFIQLMFDAFGNTAIIAETDDLILE